MRFVVACGFCNHFFRSVVLRLCSKSRTQIRSRTPSGEVLPQGARILVFRCFYSVSYEWDYTEIGKWNPSWEPLSWISCWYQLETICKTDFIYFLLQQNRLTKVFRVVIEPITQCEPKCSDSACLCWSASSSTATQPFLSSSHNTPSVCSPVVPAREVLPSRALVFGVWQHMCLCPSVPRLYPL